MNMSQQNNVHIEVQSPLFWHFSRMLTQLGIERNMARPNDPYSRIYLMSRDEMNLMQLTGRIKFSIMRNDIQLYRVRWMVG